MKLCLDRTWNLQEHFRHFVIGSWLSMQDSNGEALVGIEGMRGVRGQKKDGSYIGGDFIRMQPGSRFPLHSHEGDHEIYVMDGFGFVHINGEDVAVTAGHLVHIPAEYPHGVWVPIEVRGPLTFLAMGHPHKLVDALDRMQLRSS